MTDLKAAAAAAVAASRTSAAAFAILSDVVICAYSAASDAAAAAASDAASAASAAASAAAAFTDAAASYSALSEDASRIDEEGGDPEMPPPARLWHAAGMPEELASDWRAVVDTTGVRSGPWAFWLDWYEGFLNGRPLDWRLQREIALIPDEEWDKGAEHIAGLIRQIEARRLREFAAIAEIVWFDEDAARFDVRPTEVRRPDVLRLAVSRVEDAFEDTLALGRGQGVREDGHEALILRRVFARYRDDPQRVEMDFVDVAGIIARQIEVKEYPDSTDLQALIRALGVAASEICATHPDVAEARERLDAQARIEPPSEADQERLVEALPILRAISSERLGAGFAEDVPELVNDALLPPSGGAPRLPPAGPRRICPRKGVARRVAFRVASMAAALNGIVGAIAASTGYKAVEIVNTISGLVRMLLSWLSG